MKLLVSSALVLALLFASAGCGAFFVGGAINTGSIVQGTVNAVRLTTVNGNLQVTLVTFLNNGFSSSMLFCGNQIGSFPLNQTVQVNFNSGQPCATLVFVLTLG